MAKAAGHEPEAGAAGEPASAADPVAAAEARALDFEDDNPFLAIAEELEAAHAAPGTNGNQPPPTDEAPTGAAAESAANMETSSEGDGDGPRGVATDA
jgi:hypothetical protein